MFGDRVGAGLRRCRSNPCSWGRLRSTTTRNPRSLTRWTVSLDWNERKCVAPTPVVGALSSANADAKDVGRPRNRALSLKPSGNGLRGTGSFVLAERARRGSDLGDFAGTKPSTTSSSPDATSRSDNLTQRSVVRRRPRQNFEPRHSDTPSLKTAVRRALFLFPARCPPD